MLTKILFTALVIIVVFTAARIRANALRAPAPAPSGAEGPRRASRRSLAYLVAVGLIVSAVSGYYYFWSRWHEVVTIRVTNSRSGESVSYEAWRGSIREREFRTTDGWRVEVSNAERIEVRPGRSDRAPGND